MNPALSDLSARLLLAVRTGDAAEAERLVARMAGLDPSMLAGALAGDPQRVAA